MTGRSCESPEPAKNCPAIWPFTVSLSSGGNAVNFVGDHFEAPPPKLSWRSAPRAMPIGTGEPHGNRHGFHRRQPLRLWCGAEKWERLRGLIILAAGGTKSDPVRGPESASTSADLVIIYFFRKTCQPSVGPWFPLRCPGRIPDCSDNSSRSGRNLHRSQP